ncbi:C4-dicarboxylate TRAP transporter substrate-binding protein [Stutzerimonas stutzeri]|uniref:C4-dicarboxylate ABC transporter substrate-binding protein n=1 Tax=Stutzerimonas stutzeri TaxID=316 RepID=A0A6I6LRK8_STUST|nr:C4-dicarboxylate TRAP transporter substrate-binding protein [Stutzerimonas stutzeri]QGZ31135.1 hypothetical protein GQA94_14090 [Stutzerimonas stutzeri]
MLTNNKKFAVMAVGAALTASISVSPSAMARDLTYASYLPPHHPTSLGIKTFIDKVQSETDGSVSFKLFPSGAAASGPTMLTAVRDGLIDAGFMVSVYFPTSIPANSIISDLSFWNQNSLVTAAAAVDTVLNGCEQCLQEFSEYDVRFLSNYATPPYQAMCKGEFPNGFEPKGLRMRVAGEEMGRWVEQIGGVPVNIPNNEAYEAMERGQLDCVIGATSWLKSLSLNEVVDSVITLPMGAFQGGSNINVRDGLWQDLSTSEQKVLVDATPIALARTIFAYESEEAEAREAAQENGIKFVEVSPMLKQTRDEFMQSQLARAAATAKGRGVSEPEQIVSNFINNLEKWEKLVADGNITEEQYAELLRTEIYDKASL